LLKYHEDKDASFFIKLSRVEPTREFFRNRNKVRVAAVRALALLKKPSSADVDEILAKAAHHRDAAVRREAASARRSLAGEAAEMDWHQPDEPELSGKRPAVPASVRKVQTECRKSAKAPIERLKAAIRDRDIAVRIAAVEVLKEIDNIGQDVSRYLFDALQDPCCQVRWTAHSALHKLLVNRSAAWSRQRGIGHDCLP
jgi:HEAT repeat protein